MRRQYFRLSALLVAAFMVMSLGVAPVLADDAPRTINIKHEATKVKHRGIFEISFVGFARFFRTAYHRVNEVVPFVPPPVFDPVPGEYDQPVFLMTMPENNDPSEVPSPDVIDDPSPI